MADDRVGDKLFEVEIGPVAARAVTAVGVHKRFRHYDQSQSFLLPPSLDDWLPENHEARFISDVVDTLLDLDCIYDSYTEASGAPRRNNQDLWMRKPSDYAATSFSPSSDRSAITPFSKTTPARTRATRCGALTARQRVWADSISL
jgi:hypothetical protein